MNDKNILTPVGIFLLLLFILPIIVNYNKANNEAENMNRFGHIKLSGVIIKKSVVSKKECLFKIKTFYSYPKEYDIRGKDIAYLCVIKQGYAEVVGGCHLTSLNDTLTIEDGFITINKKNGNELKYQAFPKKFLFNYRKIRKLHDL